MSRVQAEERLVHARKRTQNTQRKYLQLPVNLVGSRDGSKYIALLAADLLKSLLPVTRNPHKEPKCVSSQHVEFSQRISHVECRSASFQIQICLFQLPVQTTKHFSNAVCQFSLLRYPNWLFFNFSDGRKRKMCLAVISIYALALLKCLASSQIEYSCRRCDVDM